MGELVPTKVTDRNGRVTTVYKKLSGKSLRRLVGMQPVPKEAGRLSLINAINDEVNSLRDYKGLKFPSSRLPTHLLHGVLSLLTDDESDPKLVDTFEQFAETTKTKSAFIKWSDAMVSYYPVIDTFGSSGTRFSDALVIGGYVASLLNSRDTGESAGMTERQELAFIEMRQTATGTELIGNLFFRHTAYGLGIYHNNDEQLRAFVKKHPDERTLSQAASLVRYGKVQRIEELEAVSSGEVPSTLIEGAL